MTPRWGFPPKYTGFYHQIQCDKLDQGDSHLLDYKTGLREVGGGDFGLRCRSLGRTGTRTLRLPTPCQAPALLSPVYCSNRNYLWQSLGVEKHYLIVKYFILWDKHPDKKTITTLTKILKLGVGWICRTIWSNLSLKFKEIVYMKTSNETHQILFGKRWVE
jgi:hypothetical protein